MSCTLQTRKESQTLACVKGQRKATESGVNDKQVEETMDPVLSDIYRSRRNK